MATFQENIRKIRGEAIYGQDMRTAIADAITQAIDLDVEGDGLVLFDVTPIPEIQGDYLLTIMNEETSNILDKAAWVDGKYLDADGTVLNAANMHYSSLIPISKLDTYKVSFTPAGSTLRNMRVHGYNAQGTWVRQLAYSSPESQTAGTRKDVLFSANDCKYVRISIDKGYENVYMMQTSYV